MMLLATQAYPQMVQHTHPNLGCLIQPRWYGRIEDISQEFRWAADNDAFNGGVDGPAFSKMLDRIVGLPNCLFVACPDSVGDAVETARLFEIWEPAIRRRGLPIAYVGQDGLIEPPWHRIDAFFIGGTDSYKGSEQAARTAREAKERGLWVHMGRVNSLRRIRYAHSLGCDSIDGTSWVRWRAAWLDLGLDFVSSPRQMGLRL